MLQLTFLRKRLKKRKLKKLITGRQPQSFRKQVVRLEKADEYIQRITETKKDGITLAVRKQAIVAITSKVVPSH